MAETLNKTELADRLATTFNGIAQTVTALTPVQFDEEVAPEWSAAGYLKHLFLSVKPFARALGLPADKLRQMFGAPERPSMSYDDLVALYHKRLAEGVKAENVPPVTPAAYRLPEGTNDPKLALLTSWIDAGERLLTALENVDEEMLDSHQLPHPAIGPITLREMLYFTVYHNTMHWRDIERVGGASAPTM